MAKQNSYWGADETPKTSQSPVLVNNDLPEIIEKVENNIYFYSEVYRDSILKLNKDIATLNNDLLYKSIVTKNQPANIYLN